MNTKIEVVNQQKIKAQIKINGALGIKVNNAFRKRQTPVSAHFTVSG